MIKRLNYLNLLMEYKNKNIIKVITGIRRCGKSTLLRQFIDLIKQEADSSKIIYINLEEIENEEMKDYHKLYTHITSKIKGPGTFYVFIDEVQECYEFQKAINSLHVKNNIDIYITGSNAKMLSGELATFLAGRYIEFEILPLSFKEYLEYY